MVYLGWEFEQVNFVGIVKLFRETLGLELTRAEEEFAILRTGDGDKIEIFGPTGNTINTPLPHPLSDFW